MAVAFPALVVACRDATDEPSGADQSSLEEDEDCVPLDEPAQDDASVLAEEPDGEGSASATPTTTIKPMAPPPRPPPPRPTNSGRVPTICPPRRDAGARRDAAPANPCHAYKKGDRIPGTFTATRQDVVNRCIAEGGAEMCEGSQHSPCAGTHTHGTVTLAGGARCGAIRCDGDLNDATRPCTRAILTACEPTGALSPHSATSGQYYDP